MALEIERILDSRFEFSLDGGDPISDNAPNLTTFGDICHFKTKNGANIIKNQNITYADVTVIDTFGGTGSYTFANIQNLWTKLIDLNFFVGVAGSGGGGGVTRFDALLDTFTYFGNDGKVPVVDESQLELVPTTFYNFNEFTQLEDVSIETLIAGKVLSVALVGGTPKIVLSDPIESGEEYFSAVGGFYYADLTTQTTALAYTTGDLQLENDIEGDDTFLSQPPYGITGVWDEGTNTFDFSQLSIGDEIILRVDLNVTTSAANQTSNVKILLGEGTADEKTLVLDTFYTETAGATIMTSKIHFDIRNENQRVTAAKLLFSSDASADIEVVGFHPYIIRKSVNILDVNDNTFKTFTVAQLASPTVDTSTNIGTVKIGYEGVGNKLTNILFDLDFSKYLENVDTLLSSKNVDVVIYNKTKNKFLSTQITSTTEPSTGYRNTVLSQYIDLADVAVNDELDINFSVYTAGGGSGTDLSKTVTPNQITIHSSTGNDVILPEATGGSAGLLTGDRLLEIVANNAKNSYPSGDATKVGNISVTQAVDLDQMESDIGALANGMVYKDDWDASSGSFPGGGLSEIGWFYNVSVGGTVDGVEFAVGDSIIAKVDNASTSTYDANWVKKDQTDAVQSVAGLVGTITDSGLRTAINVEDGATANDTDANLRDRSTHTGTQTASTISDFDTEVENNTEVAANTSHRSNTSNPHGVTKTQVGLGNVDNTSDSNKPISTATQTALDSKADKYGTRITNATVTGTYSLDHNTGNDWKLTLTGNTTFSDINLPTGTNTKEFTIKMTGDFTATFPAYWDIVGDDYDGTKWNFIAIQIHNGTSSNEEVTAFISNLP